MSHPQQLGFLTACVVANEDLVRGGRVLEIGSYDVNGSVRQVFAGATLYMGVDLVEGPGVDRVADGSQLDDPDGSWDVTLSGECFEHDPHWEDTFGTMVRVTRPGGLVTFTCASTGRVEHGTHRTMAAESPGTQAVGIDHYRNVPAAEVRQLPLDDWFSTWTLHYDPVAADLYFAGVRAGSPATGGRVASLPAATDVARLASLMTRRERVVRAPLRCLAAVTTGPESYQRLAIPYWRLVLAGIRLSERVRGGHGPGRP